MQRKIEGREKGEERDRQREKEENKEVILWGVQI